MVSGTPSPTSSPRDTEGPRPGWLRTRIARIASPQHALDAAALRDEAEARGATVVARCSGGTMVTVRGTVRSVTLRPCAGVPSLEADLFDGTGSLKVIWLGRRQIGGVEPGRTMTVHGRITCPDGDDARTMFNPRYELKPARSA